MAHLFRTAHPVRTCSKKYADYHAYKPYLAADFHNRCGYTDCTHHWFGGRRTFQIDHIKPESKYPDLINEYGNLVYCCSYVNRAKSDDDNPNYLDPCAVDYNNHFERDDKGFIIAKTSQGKYMVEHMQLNLFRYAIIWNLDRLSERIDKLSAITNRTQEVKDLLLELYEEHRKYWKYLEKEL
jgi:hypothetical protein